MGGHPPIPVETILRVYRLKNWYALSDRMAAEMLHNSERHVAVQINRRRPGQPDPFVSTASASPLPPDWSRFVRNERLSSRMVATAVIA